MQYLRLATFGSCLSRIVGNQIIKELHAEIISSVYHVRSDAYIGRFIENNWTEYSLDVLKETFYKKPTTASTLEESVEQIILNQDRLSIGGHALDVFVPFPSALESQPDLIIVDNHVDLGARLCRKLEDERAGSFVLWQDDHPGWTLGQLLSGEEGAGNMSRLLAHFRAVAPVAAIVFINFPYSAYGEDSERADRARRYERALIQPHDALVLPLRDIPEERWGNDSAHFKAVQYRDFATEIIDFIRNSGILKSQHVRVNVQQQSRQINTMYAAGQFAELAELEKLVDHSALSGQALYRLGMACWKEGRSAEGCALLISAAQREPELRPALENAIRCAAAINDIRLAELLALHSQRFPDEQRFRGRHCPTTI
ncbi:MULTISPECIES: hypothetical protein [unclassified Methylobacterium]|uniref:hypothetical protein n=1 Tax=unclassified Methylobacterium TaxID=2615210 RepID=UPI000B265955|nr:MULTISPECIES: hypothetical protein [unclassified Methylobacterium]